MATENRQITLGQKASELPSDHSPSATEARDQPSEREVFVGDEAFFKQLADSGQTTTAQQLSNASQPLPVPFKHKRFSTLQKALIASIVVIAAMLLYTLLKSRPGPVTSRSPTSVYKRPSVVQRTPSTKPPAEASANVVQGQAQEQQMELPPAQSLSLKVAETLYQEKNYGEAFAVYDGLRQGLPTDSEEQLLRDFLQLRMALCMKKAADFDHATHLFRTVLESHSPVVRAVANYNLSLLEMQKKQYLKARTRAYQAIALIDAIDFGGDWVLPLSSDCQFLVAESITRKILSLCDTDKNLPTELWSRRWEVDPFTGLSDVELRPFLNSGSKQLSKGLLAPQIQRLIKPEAPGPRRWFVTCHSASIEELLTRFAANADLDIHWASGLDSTGIRKRPVSLYLPATTTQQFVTVSVSCAGLLARIDEKGVVNIFNPAEYSSLSEHVSLLIQEAVSLWQRFILTFYNDKRIPNAHFALALLKAQKGQVTDAIAEYKLVANRFSNTSLAPSALLHSSKLKTNLHDYLGAREDLEQLIEQYPDTKIANQACLHLAEVTMKAGFKTEAVRLYRKVYNIGFSAESQTSAALGAGKCFYQIKDFEAASKWLTRHISLAKDHTSKDLYWAYFLLGKSNLALGKPQEACTAFQYALSGQLSKEEYIETISALVRTHLKLGNFIEALDVLENVQPWHLSEEESIEILLLKSEILRTMGLVDKAVAALRNRAEYISDAQLKAKIAFELAKCHVAGGNPELARTRLTEILIAVEGGPLAHEVAFKLAEVCLKLGQNSQAISVCLQLLNSAPSARIKQKTLDVLATAYGQQKNYDKAALVLAGRWNGTEAPSRKTTSDASVIPDKLPKSTQTKQESQQ